MRRGNRFWRVNECGFARRRMGQAVVSRVERPGGWRKSNGIESAKYSTVEPVPIPGLPQLHGRPSSDDVANVEASTDFRAAMTAVLGQELEQTPSPLDVPCVEDLPLFAPGAQQLGAG